MNQKEVELIDDDEQLLSFWRWRNNCAVLWEGFGIILFVRRVSRAEVIDPLVGVLYVVANDALAAVIVALVGVVVGTVMFTER